MGQGPTATRFTQDVDRGRTGFGKLESGVGGETGLNNKHLSPYNTMTINNEINSQVNAKTPFNDVLLIGWALTVEHEYVHMDQKDPGQVPKDENPAWAHTLDVCQGWMREVRSEMVNVDMQPDSPGKASTLRDLAKLMDGLRQAHNVSISSGVKEGINDTHSVDPKGPWPMLGMGSSSNIDDVMKDANDKAALFTQNALADAAAVEKRLKEAAKEQKEAAAETRRQLEQKQKETRAKEDEKKKQEQKKAQQTAKPAPPTPPVATAPATPAGPATITTTKGEVRSKDGSRIVSTETRDANDRLISTSNTEYDKNGDKVGETTYAGGTGEGQQSDLKDAEPSSAPPASGDTKDVMGGHLDGIDAATVAKTAVGFGVMDKHQKIKTASTAGSDKLNEAMKTREQAERDVMGVLDDLKTEIAKADRENSWNKAIGDALQTGITAGGAAFGTAVGAGLADKATQQIFDKNKGNKTGDSSTGSSKVSSGGSSSSGHSGGGNSSKGGSHSSSGGSSSAPPGTNAPTSGTNTTATTHQCPMCGAKLNDAGNGRWVCPAGHYEEGAFTSSTPATTSPDKECFCPKCGREMGIGKGGYWCMSCDPDHELPETPISAATPVPVPATPPHTQPPSAATTVGAGAGTVKTPPPPPTPHATTPPPPAPVTH